MERVVFIVFVVLGLVLVNSELWICNETLFWLSCLTANFYFWTIMIIIKSCCFWVLFGILLVGENSSVMYVYKIKKFQSVFGWLPAWCRRNPQGQTFNLGSWAKFWIVTKTHQNKVGFWFLRMYIRRFYSLWLLKVVLFG